MHEYYLLGQKTGTKINERIQNTKTQGLNGWGGAGGWEVKRLGFMHSKNDKKNEVGEPEVDYVIH